MHSDWNIKTSHKGILNDGASTASGRLFYCPSFTPDSTETRTQTILPFLIGSLLVIVVSVLVNDVEELELVNSFASGDNTEPVAELELLEELLGPRYC